MLPQEIDALLTDISAAQRKRGGDSAQADLLREDLSVWEVVGRWPPAPASIVDEVALDELLRQLRELERAVHGGAPSTQLGEVIAQLEIARLPYSVKSEPGSYDFGTPDDRFGHDHYNADIVGKWPPE